MPITRKCYKLATIWGTLNAYHIIDWAIILGIHILGYVLETMPPVQRQIVLSESIKYPHLDNETVPSYLLFILSTLIPLISIALLLKVFKKQSWKIVHLTLLALFISIGYTNLITNVVKLSVGRFRPDFISRCNPSSLVSSTIVCNPVSSRILNEGRKSFPSGHSSRSFSGLGYLALVLVAQTKSKHAHGRPFRMFIITLPLMCATLVAVSRLIDHRHHWEDVVVGSLLGLFMAYFSYRQFFPNPINANYICANEFEDDPYKKEEEGTDTEEYHLVLPCSP